MRISAYDAIEHPYFKQLGDAARELRPGWLGQIFSVVNHFGGGVGMGREYGGKEEASLYYILMLAPCLVLVLILPYSHSLTIPCFFNWLHLS